MNARPTVLPDHIVKAQQRILHAAGIAELLDNEGAAAEAAPDADVLFIRNRPTPRDPGTPIYESVVADLASSGRPPAWRRAEGMPASIVFALAAGVLAAVVALVVVFA